MRLFVQSARGNRSLLSLGLASCGGAVALAAMTTAAWAVAPVVNPGTNNWVTAARTGRADMLVIGDSLVAGGDGWDAGFINAGARNLGLAGSGITVDSAFGGYGEGYW